MAPGSGGRAPIGRDCPVRPQQPHQRAPCRRRAAEAAAEVCVAAKRQVDLQGAKKLSLSIFQLGRKGRKARKARKAIETRGAMRKCF